MSTPPCEPSLKSPAITPAGHTRWHCIFNVPKTVSAIEAFWFRWREGARFDAQVSRRLRSRKIFCHGAVHCRANRPWAVSQSKCQVRLWNFTAHRALVQDRFLRLLIDADQAGVGVAAEFWLWEAIPFDVKVELRDSSRSAASGEGYDEGRHDRMET